MQTPSLASSIGVLPTRGVPRPKVAFLAGVALVASLAAISPSLHSTPAVSGPGIQGRAAEGYGNLPISFEPNVGQAPGRYDFVARGQGFGMSISATGATLALGTGKVQGLVRLDLLGASPSADPRALESLPGKVNYLIGNDPSKWRSEVPTFGSVSYRDVLPGIDVIYHGTNAGTLEYDFVVAPDADPGDIRVGFSGVNDVALRGGNLVITKAGGTVTQGAPVLYQTIAGRRIPVNGRFSLSGDQVGFEVGAYDHTHTLVIDPTLTYSTYLGGSNDDIGYAIAVDGTGAAYVAGYTTSTNFPTQAPFQASVAGQSDAFVTKLNATGSLIYSTYLGGSNGADYAQGIAVDGTGAAYVAGYTTSTNFPTQAPFQASNAGVGGGAFITKLNAAGSALIYSTYLGGSNTDIAQGIAVDGSGAAYVTGYTVSSNFPTQLPFQASNAGSKDVFVSKLNATGQTLIYSTYLGGSNNDIAQGIAVDGTGAAYVTGSTSSAGFPTQLPFQGSNAGSKDAFVTKLNATGQALTYSTYLGGSSIDSGWGIAVDGAGAAYVAGFTNSTNFPTHLPFQASDAGQSDAFVTKLNAAGSALTYSTYIGGSGDDFAHGIAVDGSGAAYVAGYTNSTNFPTQAPFQASNAGQTDAFVTKLNAAGSALTYSTYLGGSGYDVGWPIGIDGTGAAYVTGYTLSADFPTQAPFEAAYSGSYDAFVTKLSGTTSVTCDGQTVTIQVPTAGLNTWGTAGNDVINGTSGTDNIYGLGGNDIICGLGGTDKLYGDAGTDKLYGGTAGDALLGGTGSDTLYGNDGSDELLGGAGSDTIHAAVGSDTLYGNDGSDTLYGNDGGDRLLGGTGGDSLYGNNGNDSIWGNDGNDSLDGGANTDACDGGLGTDNGTLCETSISIP